ncbi:hypothetical protein BCR43DRAFT_489692 [Syncephalastrum racemosum]|uniref:F-box domain-containing protein n=1 Tax=Syncephalastrum racemosum TaxID=13706 RepID=A0A1X2HEN5_SYNRA|nr:hypothetical protein BCR43DRAFT_489692 [Syncephalastrum racemosum]
MKKKKSYCRPLQGVHAVFYIFQQAFQPFKPLASPPNAFLSFLSVIQYPIMLTVPLTPDTLSRLNADKDEEEQAENALSAALIILLESRLIKAWEAHRFESAMKTSESLMTRFPDEPTGYRWAGDIAMARHNYARAIDFYRRYVALYPSGRTQLAVAEKCLKKKVDPFGCLPDDVIEIIIHFVLETRLTMMLVSSSWRARLLRLPVVWRSMSLNFTSQPLSLYFESAPRRYLGPHIHHLTLKCDKTLCAAAGLLALGQCVQLRSLEILDATKYHDEKYEDQDQLRLCHRDFARISLHLTKLTIETQLVPQHTLQYILKICPQLETLIYRVKNPQNAMCDLPIEGAEPSGLQPSRIKHLEWPTPDDLMVEESAARLPESLPRLEFLWVRSMDPGAYNEVFVSDFLRKLQDTCPALEQLYLGDDGVQVLLEQKKSLQKPATTRGIRQMALWQYCPSHEELEVFRQIITRHANTLECLHVTLSGGYFDEEMEEVPDQVQLPPMPHLTSLMLQDAVAPSMEPFHLFLSRCQALQKLALHQLEFLSDDVFRAILQLPDLRSLTLDMCDLDPDDIALFVTHAVALGETCPLRELHITARNVFWLAHLGRLTMVKHMSFLCPDPGDLEPVAAQVQRTFLDHAAESGLTTRLESLYFTANTYNINAVKNAFAPGVVREAK